MVHPDVSLIEIACFARGYRFAHPGYVWGGYRQRRRSHSHAPCLSEASKRFRSEGWIEHEYLAGARHFHDDPPTAVPSSSVALVVLQRSLGRRLSRCSARWRYAIIGPHREVLKIARK